MPIALQTESREFGRFLEYTRDKLLPGIINNAIDSQPLLSIMTGRIANQRFNERGPSGMGKMVTGGATIEKKVRLGKNETVQALSSGFAAFDTTPQDNVRHARFNWKLYGGTVNISGHEVDVNSSDEAVANMVEEEMRDAVNSLADLIGTHLYSNSSISTQVTGLLQLISANDSVGGLSGATYYPWNSRGVSADGTAAASITFTPTTTSFAAAGLANMRTAWNQSSEGESTKPDVVVTNLTNHERYEGSLEPQHRIMDMRLADGGIQALAFKTAPIIADRKCPSGAMFFLNFDTLKLAVLAGADFASSPFTEPDTQRVRVSKVYVTLEQIIMDRKRNNRLAGITA